MSQPVKLSDALVLDARLAGQAQQRSIAGQVEFWARLGRSLELSLDGKTVLELSRSSGSQSLSELLDMVDTHKGRKMFKTYLESEPYPHYEAHPKNPDLLIRIEEDGTRTAGRFVNRKFIVESLTRSKKVAAEGLRSPKSGALTVGDLKTMLKGRALLTVIPDGALSLTDVRTRTTSHGAKTAPPKSRRYAAKVDS